MIGIGGLIKNPCILNGGEIAYRDFFTNSVIQSNLERQFIAIHPGSVDPSNRAVWFDLSPYRSNANLFNTPTLTDFGWVFNGINQFGSYTWPLTGRSTYFTIEMWVKPDRVSDIYFGGQSVGGVLFRRAVSVHPNYNFQFQFQSASGSNTVISSTHKEPDNRLYHLCFIRDNTIMNIAINGVIVNLGTISGSPSGELTTPMNWIGRYVNSYYPGLFYYYAVYSKALNSEEVHFNYYNNKARFE
jgi:hypothetical protein